MFLSLATARAQTEMIDLEASWDPTKLCENPHKGWYLHYFDNGLSRYGRGYTPERLADFPGLNDIYLRLAWSYLEPEEGQFNWAVIDTVIERWVAAGHTISFRITCKETGEGQTFATPQWVRAAGAKGTFFDYKGERTWEPDYGDSIFLAKLEAFHAAFAARYDGQPWVEYIDLGSYGDWGEWHTSKGSRRDWPFEVLKQHIDLHLRHYHHTPLLISDDIISSRLAEDGSKAWILAYLKKHGISLRDDSILLNGWERYGKSTVRQPELFEAFYRQYPINLELGHYRQHVKKYGTWGDGEAFRLAVEQLHPTYLGFHGDAEAWLADHAAETRVYANRAGYWYFPKRMYLPTQWTPGQLHAITMLWENHGVAPAYYPYELYATLYDQEGREVYRQLLVEADNRTWLPGQMQQETYSVHLPPEIASGTYQLGIGLIEPVHAKNDRLTVIELGLANERKLPDGFYRMGPITIP